MMMFPSYISLVIDSIRSHSRRDDDDGKDTNTTPPNDFYNVILGNEAGDADSLVSALGMSYVKSISLPAMDGTTGHHPTPIPVMSIRREDMALRRDVVNLLTMAGIDTEHDLLYLDDGMVRSKLILGGGGGAEDANNATNNNHNHNHNTVTLVDHNKLCSSLWHLEGNVVEIIDHHYDEICYEGRHHCHHPYLRI